MNDADKNQEAIDQPAKPKQRRGFALLSTEQMSKIAAQGGRTAHQTGHAHKWTRAEAKEAAAKSVGVRQAKAQTRKAKPQ